MQVNFKFKLGQWVVTPFGKKGYISSLSIGESGMQQCYVELGEDRMNDWFLEDKLKLA